MRHRRWSVFYEERCEGNWERKKAGYGKPHIFIAKKTESWPPLDLTLNFIPINSQSVDPVGPMYVTNNYTGIWRGNVLTDREAKRIEERGQLPNGHNLCAHLLNNGSDGPNQIGLGRLQFNLIFLSLSPPPTCFRPILSGFCWRRVHHLLPPPPPLHIFVSPRRISFLFVMSMSLWEVVETPYFRYACVVAPKQVL